MHGKTHLIVLFGCFIACVAYFINIINDRVISQGVNKIELRQAYADMSQLYSLLSAATLRLKQHTYDWSHWDEAYNYIDNKNPTFLDHNLDRKRLQELHITAVALYHFSEQRLVFLDGSKFEFGDLWVEAEAIMFDQIFRMLKDKNLESADGFVYVNGVGMLIAAHKIYSSDSNKKPNGYLIMSSALDSGFRARSLMISSLDFSVLNMNVFNLHYSAKAHGENFKFLQTAKEVRVYSIVNDIFGQPAFCLELRKPRDIAKFGNLISQENFRFMLLLCVIVLGAGLAMLHFAHKKFTQEELKYRSTHDTLTGLPNQILLLQRLNASIKAISKLGGSLGLLYIDLDNFKSINNCYGYQQGDAVLREAAKRLQANVPTGNVGRSSVDNFQIVLRAPNQDVILANSHKILAAMNQPVAINGNSVHIGTSIGLAFLSKDCKDAVDLVHRAELAMYDAKEHGGNTISCYHPDLDLNASSKKQLENALYEALENNNLTVHYQPKIDISLNDVAGCEALVRWQQKDGKWVPPPVFIPLAEQTGLVTSIDMFVLRSACRQVLAWAKDGSGSVPIAVNMSVRSILSDGFAEKVINILSEEGTSPSLIDIEITETSFMSDMNKALQAISKLHDAGIHIALDDFGTGYSSLQYLSAMPISFLKIDKKFVDDIFSGKMCAQPLVKSILSLASNLGMRTISEGVEEKQQLQFLAANGAKIIQGYIFSKPLNATECGLFLRNRKARIAEVLNHAA